MRKIWMMESHRMIRQKSLWIILLVGCSVFMLNGYMKKDTVFINHTTSETSTLITSDTMNQPNAIKTVNNQIDFLQFYWRGNILLILLIVSISFFIRLFYSSGFYKHILGMFEMRGRLVIVDYLLFCVVALVVVLLTTGSAYIGYMIGNPLILRLPFGGIGNFIRLLLQYYSLFCVLIAVIVGVMHCVRNSVAALVLLLIYVSGIPYGIVENLFNVVLMDRLPMGMLIDFGAVGQLPISALLLNGAILVGALFIAVIVKQRQDH